MTTPVAKIIDEIVREGFASELKAAGYKKQGRNFRRTTPECIQIVNVQASMYGTSEAGRFTINLGIYFPVLDDILESAVRPKGAPSEAHCHLRERIGLLMPENRDHWWQVTSQSEASGLANEIRGVWCRFGVPWMLQNSNLVGAHDLKWEAKQYFTAAAISLALGERERAKDQLHRELTERSQFSSKPYIERIVSWGRKHNLLTDEQSGH